MAVAARRGDRLEALAAGIRNQGGTALVLECDITDEQQAVGAVERTVAELGRLGTLINNAGVMLLGPVMPHRAGAIASHRQDALGARPEYGRRCRPADAQRSSQMGVEASGRDRCYRPADP